MRIHDLKSIIDFCGINTSERVMVRINYSGTGIEEVEVKSFDQYTDALCLNVVACEREETGWKPSKEQMDALHHAIDACESEWGYEDTELRSLINDLKKLKGE